MLAPAPAVWVLPMAQVCPMGAHEADWERVSVLACKADGSIKQVGAWGLLTGTHFGSSGCRPLQPASATPWQGSTGRGTGGQRRAVCAARALLRPHPASTGHEASALQVSYSQHAWTEVLDCERGQCPFEDGHPVAHAALETHANYPQPSPFVVSGRRQGAAAAAAVGEGVFLCPGHARCSEPARASSARSRPWRLLQWASPLVRPSVAPTSYL